MLITISKYLVLIFFLFLVRPIDCLSSPPYSVRCWGMPADIFLGMTKTAFVETLGAPDRVKSDGLCFQYDGCDLSIFFNKNGESTQIYLGKKFIGTIAAKDQPGMSAAQLFDTYRADGEQTLYYTPSTTIQNSASVESENKPHTPAITDPRLPVEYRGSRKKYDLVAGDRLMKTKYVFDEDQIAFWLDSNQVLYATVLFSPENDLDKTIKPAAEPPEPDAEGWRLIYFDFDQDQIKSEYFSPLDTLSDHMRIHMDQRFLIEGHADEKGTEEYNSALGYRRAISVLDYLKERGVASERLSCTSHGESNPISPNRTPDGKDFPEGRSNNRRVEIKSLPTNGNLPLGK